MSSANSGIYSTSRMVYGLAQEGDAPAVFGALSGRKVPRNALFLSCVLLLSGVVLMYAGQAALGVTVNSGTPIGAGVASLTPL